MDANSTAFRFNLMPERERLDLVAAGAVGDMLFNFYDSEGAIIDHPVNRRIMSVAIDKLRNAPARVLASGGPEKIACILGAIKLADINVLVTDEQTAETLLARSA
jgi:DNA-binding transcriptional regulator LsrR (DeoR family)